MDDSKHDFRDLQGNPFLALFPNIEDAEQYIDATKSILDSTQNDVINNTINKDNEADENGQSTEIYDGIINDFLQRVFLVTVIPDPDYFGSLQHGGVPSRCIFLRNLHEELTDTQKVARLNKDCLNQALLERLQMNETASNILPQSGKRHALEVSEEQVACENRLIKYMFESFTRLLHEEEGAKRRKNKSTSLLDTVADVASESRSLIFDFSRSILYSPEVFASGNGSSLPKQVLDVLKMSSMDVVAMEFLRNVVVRIDDDDELAQTFRAVLELIYEDAESVLLLDPDLCTLLDALLFFANERRLARLLLDSPHWYPPHPLTSGLTFETKTIIGRLLHLSPIPSSSSSASDYFLSPSHQDEANMRAMTENLRLQLEALVAKLHEVLTALLAVDRARVLSWLGVCLHLNRDREKMMFDTHHVASSGFFLNLTHLLLKFCEPFLNPNSKILHKIDYRFCAVTMETMDLLMRDDARVHLIGMSKLEPMAKTDGEISRPDDDLTFKFPTEIFFMTHIVFKLGWSRVFESYRKLMHELNKMSQAYNEIRSQGAGNEAIETFKDKFESGLRLQMATKAHLLNRHLSDLVVRFSVASSDWLVQRALPEGSPAELLPEILSQEICPPALTVIPQLIPENIGDSVRMLGGFSSDALEEADELLKYIMQFFAVFMGSSKRLYNPHSRAKLAECLAYFIPQDSTSLNQPLMGNIRAKAFERCGDAVSKLLPEALLQLFVDIEFTGDSMEFYQKFSYRHYMYAILEYIWKMPSYHKTFQEMFEVSRLAYKNDMIFTTFPRFISLLVNDTNHMLDEALSNLRAIRALELEKTGDEWSELSQEEREQKESQLNEYTTHAKQYNIMAKETLHVLQYVTKDITSPFVCLSMMESMAGFLNYFLALLAGKERNQLKVTDFELYKFSPSELVQMIVDIYLQLGCHDDFVRTVASDDRSYSAELFLAATNLLGKLRPDLVDDFSKLAFRLAEWKQKLTQAQSEVPEPPDEFLDPISCTLMQNPVRLPSSGQIVDESTITRHLLSDEKDPFNRSPLKLDQVIADVELRKRIQQWMLNNNLPIASSSGTTVENAEDS